VKQRGRVDTSSGAQGEAAGMPARPHTLLPSLAGWLARSHNCVLSAQTPWHSIPGKREGREGDVRGERIRRRKVDTIGRCK